MVVAYGLGRSLNIQSPLEKPLEMLCVCKFLLEFISVVVVVVVLCVSLITVNSSLDFTTNLTP